MTQLFSVAFRLAWFLAQIGFLADATAYVMKEAAHSQRHGLVSLTALNRALTTPPRRPHGHSAAEKGRAAMARNSS